MSKPKDGDMEVIFERRQCDGQSVRAPGGRCQMIVTHWAQRKGYIGPVYCRHHTPRPRGGNQ